MKCVTGSTKIEAIPEIFLLTGIKVFVQHELKKGGGGGEGKEEIGMTTKNRNLTP